MPIPNDMDFTPFDILTAAEMDNLIENDNALANGTAISNSAITPEKLLTGTGTAWAYDAWTPALTNITIVNGTITGGKKQIGKIAYGWALYTKGSSDTYGASNYLISLPFTSKASPPANGSLGNFDCYDGTGTRYRGWITYNSTTTALMWVGVATGTFLTGTQINSGNFAPGTGATFYFTYNYETA